MIMELMELISTVFHRNLSTGGYQHDDDVDTHRCVLTEALGSFYRQIRQKWKF